MQVHLLPVAAIFVTLLIAGAAQAAPITYDDKDWQHEDTFVDASSDYHGTWKSDTDDGKGDPGNSLADVDGGDKDGKKDDIFHHLDDDRGSPHDKGDCDPSAAPLPAALPLFGTGLIALAGFGFFRKQRIRRR
jgi:hypothetical protein